jgi:hypothetical protein
LSCPARYCADGARGDVHHILTRAEGLLKVAPFVVWLRQILLFVRLNPLPRFTPSSGSSRSTNNEYNNDHTPSYQKTRVPLCKDHLDPSLASVPLRTLRPCVPDHPVSCKPSPHVCAPFQARVKLTCTVCLEYDDDSGHLGGEKSGQKDCIRLRAKRQKLKRMPSARRLLYKPCFVLSSP